MIQNAEKSKIFKRPPPAQSAAGAGRDQYFSPNIMYNHHGLPVRKPRGTVPPGNGGNIGTRFPALSHLCREMMP
jgi:hypothetical protein